MTLLYLLLLTIAVSHTGIAFVGILTMPGNILDFLKPLIMKLPERLSDLFTCAKCVSGQVAFWLVVALSIWHPLYEWYFWVVGGLIWIMNVIVLTDQMNKLYKY